MRRVLAFRALCFPLLLAAILPGCVAGGGMGSGARTASAVGSTLAGAGEVTADFAYGANALLVIAAGLAAIGDSLERGGRAGGPNDEAYAARLRSAPIHARDPWVGWPPP